MTTSCLLISGCALGPQVRTDYVLIKPGVPVRILQNAKLKSKTLASEKVDDNSVGGGVVQQDVGGWVAMPAEHWDMIERKLKQAKLVEDLPKK